MIELIDDIFVFQLVNTEKIIKLRVRGTKKELELEEDASSDEVCVVMRTTIARFDGSDIQVSDMFSIIYYKVY